MSNQTAGCAGLCGQYDWLSRLDPDSDTVCAELTRLSNSYTTSSLSPMLARRSLARVVSQPSPLGATPTNARNMATLREIEMRLKSVRNIEKITKVGRALKYSKSY